MRPRSHVSAALAASLLVALAASCTAILGIDGDYDLACASVTDCPKVDETCRVAACIQGICGEVVQPDGASCGGALTCNTGECCASEDTCVEAVDGGRVPCPGTEARGQYDAFASCACDGDCYDFCAGDAFCDSGAAPSDPCLTCLEDYCAPACPGYADF